MKVEKLLTLPMLIDAVDAFPIKGVCQFYTVKGWNDFLKQKLVKEMFVNELERPKANKVYSRGMSYLEQVVAWQAAEKKVIFKNLQHHSLQPSTSFNYWTLNGVRVMHESNTGYYMMHGSLHDLAEATNGELEIKSVIL